MGGGMGGGGLHPICPNLLIIEQHDKIPLQIYEMYLQMHWAICVSMAIHWFFGLVEVVKNFCHDLS